MSLVEHERAPQPEAGTRPDAAPADEVVWDPHLPDLVLDATALADLMLGLAGVLPQGQVLGAPLCEATLESPPGEPRQVGVLLPSAALAKQALAAGGLVLRDEEHTPLAALEHLQKVPGSGQALHGIPRRLRAREGGVGGQRTVDFDDVSLHHRPLLLLERPATVDDLPALLAWAAGATAPVVLVPEHSDGRAWVPTRQLVRLATDLVEEVGLRHAEVRTVPLEPHDPRSDSALLERIARRLDATEVYSLSDTAPAGTAEQWEHARLALVDGRADGPLPGVPARTEAVLRAWLPRRSARGLALMFSGLSGSGKSTLARDVAAWVSANSTRTVTLLDGDRVRQMLSSGLGFDPASRELNVRRIGYVAAEIARHGGIAICSPIAPFATTREEVRHMVELSGDFILVHVCTPIEECERRDLKGLYARARLGQIPDFTGVSSPYDVPADADLRVDTTGVSRERAAQLVIDHLVEGGWLQGGAE